MCWSLESLLAMILTVCLLEVCAVVVGRGADLAWPKGQAAFCVNL